ncbi:response regulator [Leeuwenhoekiella sp. NPDC079379]|uniref:response regulator n=1 Tax=Leeuwenhoekiella sp. NPDC079379 TaxID=3364122 RepID=UPI0037C7133F
MSQVADIVLIDDDDVYLFVVGHMCNTYWRDLNVVTITDGELGINYLKKSKEDNIQLPKLILLDINMPYLDGWGFLNAFRSQEIDKQEEITIFMVTSSNRSCDKKRMESYPEINGFILKPVRKKELHQLLDSVFKK